MRSGTESFFVGINDALHQWMADDVGTPQADLAASGDTLESMHGIDQATAAIRGKVDLGGIA